MSAAIKKKRLRDYRDKTYRQRPGERLKTRQEAVDFVNQRGFVYFWPIKGITMPSLWSAVAGDRPVADAHDDPGHVTWGWKDALVGGTAWYYAKVLRRRATMISFDIAPYFYALSENYGSPEDDYLTLYEQGRLTQEARIIYEVLLDEGPIDTVALRRKTRMTSRASDSRFNRAMEYLQADFKILPVAVTQAGAWRYAFAYDIVARHYPELPETAQHIHESNARRNLLHLYLASVGAAQMRDIKMVFRWRPADNERALESLLGQGLIQAGITVEDQPGEWFAIDEIL
jgi:hypothetical protein